MNNEKDMRWIYKTVHYELKKEGLLGPSFLDENEIEESLNEYGKAGWELVSTMEIRDGVMAIFKQPFRMAQKAPGHVSKKRSVDPRTRTVFERQESNQLIDEEASVQKNQEVGGIRIE